MSPWPASLLQIWFTCWCGVIPVCSRISRSVRPHPEDRTSAKIRSAFVIKPIILYINATTIPACGSRDFQTRNPGNGPDLFAAARDKARHAARALSPASPNLALRRPAIRTATGAFDDMRTSCGPSLRDATTRPESRPASPRNRVTPLEARQTPGSATRNMATPAMQNNGELARKSRG